MPSLPSGIVSGLDSASLEAWVTWNDSTHWERIFDFGNRSSTQYMFLSPSNGSGYPRFAMTNGGLNNEQGFNSTTTFPTGTQAHLVVTIDHSTNTALLYINGIQVGQNTSTTFTPSSLGATVNNWLGRSQYSTDLYFNGSINEFRIYGGVLSAAQMRLIMAADQPLPHVPKRNHKFRLSHHSHNRDPDRHG